MKPLNEYTSAELEVTLRQEIVNLERRGDEWAAAKAEFESWEDKRKPYLAILMGKHEGSQALKEQNAYSEKEWKVYLEALADSRKRYLQAQVDFDLSKTKVDLYRTLLSNRREELKRFAA